MFVTDSLLGIAFFLFGAVTASFVGVVVARLATGTSFVRGRSKCDSCGVALSPFSLVPIASWLLMGGRCLVCRARLSVISPASELALGALFTLAYFKLGLVPALPFLLVALALLLALVLYDFAHAILPPSLLAPFVMCALISAVFAHPSVEAFAPIALTALLFGSSLAFVHFVSQGRAMGFADAPLTFGLALLAGESALSGFLFSFWIGGIVGIILLVRRAQGTTIQSEVPFAPFLAAGFILAYFTSWSVYDIADSFSRLLV